MVNAHLVKKHIQALDATLGDAAIIALEAERKNLEVLQKAADILTNSEVAHSLLWVSLIKKPAFAGLYIWWRGEDLNL